MYHLTVFSVKLGAYATAAVASGLWLNNFLKAEDVVTSHNKNSDSLTQYDKYKDRQNFFFQLTILFLLTGILLATLGVPAQETIFQLLKSLEKSLFGGSSGSDDSVDFSSDF